MARTAYWVIDLSSYTAPTNAQIAAGQRTGSVAAFKSGSEAFAATTGSGTITEATTVTGLSAVEYRLSWTIYDDVAANYPASAPQHFLFTPPSVYEVACAEAATAVDAQAAAAFLVAAVAESASAVDSPAVAAGLVAAMAESAGAIDAVASQAVFLVAVSDAASAADTTTWGAASYDCDAAEAAAAADSASTTAVLLAAAAEPVAATDSAQALATLLAAVSEAASAGDITNWGGAIYGVDISAVAVAADAVAAALQAIAAAAETASATDSVAQVTLLGGSLAELANAADTPSAAAAVLAAIAEAGNAADVWSAGTFGDLTGDIIESTSATDALIVISVRGITLITERPRRRVRSGAVYPLQTAGAGRPGNLPGKGR